MKEIYSFYKECHRGRDLEDADWKELTEKPVRSVQDGSEK